MGEAELQGGKKRRVSYKGRRAKKRTKDSSAVMVEKKKWVLLRKRTVEDPAKIPVKGKRKRTANLQLVAGREHWGTR